MDEQTQDVAEETPAAEVVEGEDETVGAPDGDELEGVGADDDGEPDEDDAELLAQIERDHDEANVIEDDTPSIEAQHRDQMAKQKKLDQLASHVAKRYGEILGPDLDGFVACPLCAPWYPGIRLQVMPEYETVSAVKVAIGEDPDPPLKQDIHSIVCSDCDGLGKVLTGSKVPGNASAQCIACNGTGWQPTDNARKPGTVTALPVPAYHPVPGEVLPAGDEPAEVAALKDLGYIVVPPVNTPESLAARGQ